MLQIFKELGSDLDAIVFIDPDIVVQAPWSFFDFWLRDYIALCSDVTRFAMHATHPTKLRWRRIAESLGYGWHDDTGYANAGFIGVPVEHIDFLRLWRDLGRQLEEHGFFDKAIFNHFDLCHPFGAADQDVLNMVRHITDRPLSLAGQEGMGFIPGRAYMLHAAGPRKPWRGGFLRDALRYGRRPSNVAKAFWNSVREPVPVFGRTRVALAKAELHAATLVARLTG